MAFSVSVVDFRNLFLVVFYQTAPFAIKTISIKSFVYTDEMLAPS